MVAVVGGDGAGKTTLLRALVREVPSTPVRWTLPSKAEHRVPACHRGQLGGADGRAEPRLRRRGLRRARRARWPSAAPSCCRRAGLVEAADRPAVAAVRRDAPQARVLHGDRAPALAAGPRRAEHRGGPGQPGRAVAPVAAGRSGRSRGGHGRRPIWTRPSAPPTWSCWTGAGSWSQGPVRRRPGRVPRRRSPRPSAHVRPAWSWRRGVDTPRVLAGRGPRPAAGASCPPDLEDIVIALSLTPRGSAAEAPA